ncbi:MAG: hypothetical protein M3460_25640 [Actinomycetota bacterium]|nr:hypothetical protein [Actinomycetota bacterium]
MNVYLSILPVHIAGHVQILQRERFFRFGHNRTQDPIDEVGYWRGPAPLNDDIIPVLLADYETDFDALLEQGNLSINQPMYSVGVVAQQLLIIQ